MSNPQSLKAHLSKLNAAKTASQLPHDLRLKQIAYLHRHGRTDEVHLYLVNARSEFVKEARQAYYRRKKSQKAAKTHHF